MKFQIGTLAALCVILALVSSTKVIGTNQDEISPRPGAMSLYLNTTSVNNIMQTFVPLIAYFSLNNHTYDLNITASTYMYKFNMDKFTIKTASGFTEKKFEYIPGTDKIHARLGGINLVTAVDATFEALHFIPFESSAINITNMSIDFELESKSNDGVHWAISELTKVNFDRVDIQMKNRFLNLLVKMSRPLINHLIKNRLTPAVQSYVDSQVQKLNGMVANESPYDFEVPMYGDSLALNLTMTTAPKTKKDSELIELFFDGLFDMPLGSGLKQDYHGDITDYPPRLEHSNSEQFWIHEDTFDSALRVAGAEIFPININYQSVSDTFLSVFKEVRVHYGQDVKAYFKLSQKPSSSKALTFSQKNGITFGGSNDDVITTIDVICSNATTFNETALSFELNLELNANVTLQNLIVYPDIKTTYAQNVKLVQDNVGMNNYHYNILFTQIVQKAAKIVNDEYKMGWPLANLDPQLGMLGGLLKNTTVSPYITDHWLYAGFEMQADLPNAEPVLDFIQ